MKTKLAISCCWMMLACSPDDANRTPPNPRPSAEEIARAEDMYASCVEDELGIEILELEIRASGEIDVEFGEGYTAESAALVASVCEARIASTLEPGGDAVLGPPLNLGRPGTDDDVEKLLAARVALGFEGAVLIEADGVVRASAGYGTLSADDERAPNVDTAFDCGSIMKDVTAAAIFLLEEEGALSREQTLGDVMPVTPEVWREVTIDQLLRHEAGFDTYHDTEGDFEDMDRETALSRILEQEPLFEPGSDTAYSNSGYTLLAILIEQVSAQPYATFVRERIFDPLGMDRSGFYGEPRWRDGNVAIGRGAASHEGNDPSQWSAPTWALIGNGGLVSTPSDLLRLIKGLSGTELFAPDTARAFREFAEPSGATLAGKAVAGYAGGNDFGFNAMIGQVPDDAVHVIAASHVLSPISAEILGVELLQVIYGEPLEIASP